MARGPCIKGRPLQPRAVLANHKLLEATKPAVQKITGSDIPGNINLWNLCHQHLNISYLTLVIPEEIDFQNLRNICKV